jgi:hypothetical protein
MLFEVREVGGRLGLALLDTIDKNVFSSEQQTPIYHRDHLFGVLPNSAVPSLKIRAAPMPIFLSRYQT